jgi:hypothetical protein
LGLAEVTDYDPDHPQWIEDHEILDPVVPKKIRVYDPPPEMPQFDLRSWTRQRFCIVRRR